MINQETVKNIADLARLHLETAELQRLTKELENILDYVKKLEKLDVSQTQPTTHVLSLKNVFREDRVQPSLGRDLALKTAVAKHDSSFKVPQVIE